MIESQNADISTEIPCVARPNSVDELDESAYLAANPDVQRAGLSAREHFLQYGQREGRLQWMNAKEVAAMREEKLQKLRFRRQPFGPRGYGQAANFLDAETLAEFDIPEAPPVSAHVYGGPFVEEVRQHPQKVCLDVGAGLRFSCFSNVVNTEIYPSFSTDVVCVAENLPFEDDQFDYIMCISVLEHTMRPWEAARELCRVLKPGGKILVDYPFLQNVHGYPHHYFNATPRGAVSLFEKDCEIESSVIGPCQHPIYSIWWFLINWRCGLPEKDRDAFNALKLEEILSRPPEEHLESFYCTNLSEEMKRIIPAGSTVTAIKRFIDCGAQSAEDAATSNGSKSNLAGAFRLQSELKTAQTKINTQQIELEAIRKQLEESARAMQELTGARNTLQATLAGVMWSKSWRLTSPLRAIASLLRPTK